MAFAQDAPTLGNQYDDDSTLRSYLKRQIPAEVLREIEPELRELGRVAGGELYRMQLEDRKNEPLLTQWDAWGNRVDRIEVSPLWRLAERMAAELGLVATAYERSHGRLSRIHQFALAYLFTPATDIYSCPLAMTDGAASALIESCNQKLIERAVPHLVSRDPKQFWTAGQWMTELTGGSDVGRSETVARRGADGVWRLYGRKWFTSAITSQVALTLARPEGGAPGGRGLALFYVETRDEQGRLRQIEVNRLKDKLGTRKVPTAELALVGTPAELVAGESDGVRAISPVLNLTRLWNGISAAALMRRGLALARDYAKKRVAFGQPLSEKPLHVDTLAGVEAEAEGAFHLALRVVELIGRQETGALEGADAALLRVLTPIMKLTTARQAVAAASEVVEAFGGAGYVEDSGLPAILRDSQVLSIWEGTTNVLSLDALRALGREGAVLGIRAEVERALKAVHDSRLERATQLAAQAVIHAEEWLRSASGPVLEAGARRLAMTLGRAVELALMAEQAQWSLDREGDRRARAAAVRFAQAGVDLISEIEPGDSRALLSDEPVG